jgi:mRNA interferase MazF
MAGGGDHAGKPRPIVIVQDDRFGDIESVTFVAFTSNLIESPLTRLVVEPSTANGLLKRSHLMIDKISSAPKTKLGKWVGYLPNEDMVRLNRALLVYLGLAN